MYVKYESSMTCYSKIMANVKGFADKQTDVLIEGTCRVELLLIQCNHTR